jgi:hypothetical protein
MPSLPFTPSPSLGDWIPALRGGPWAFRDRWFCWGAATSLGRRASLAVWVELLEKAPAGSVVQLSCRSCLYWNTAERRTPRGGRGGRRCESSGGCARARPQVLPVRRGRWHKRRSFRTARQCSWRKCSLCRRIRATIDCGRCSRAPSGEDCTPRRPPRGSRLPRRAEQLEICFVALVGPPTSRNRCQYIT